MSSGEPECQKCYETKLEMAKCCHDLNNYLHVVDVHLEAQMLDVREARRALRMAKDLASRTMAALARELKERQERRADV